MMLQRLDPPHCLCILPASFFKWYPRKQRGEGKLAGFFARFTDLHLSGRQVDISYHLSAGVFHLQTGVELQEVETAILAVEVLHSSCADVTDHLSQPHSALQKT